MSAAGTHRDRALRSGPTMRTGREWLRMFDRRLRARNIEVDSGSDEACEVLSRQGGEAMTVGDDKGVTILFRDKNPSVSAVLEEVAHALQHQARRYVERDALEMQCCREIEAKACLVEKEARLGIPSDETATTRKQLDEERRRLQALERRWK